MAKGGYQKKRIQQQKDQAKARRRRHRRNRVIALWTVVVLLLGGLAAGLAVGLSGSGSIVAKNSSSPTPSSSASPSPGVCHTPAPADTGKKSFPSAPCMSIDASKNYTATVVTSMGTMKVQLLAKAAPTTVNSFVFLAEHKYFDGITFHRVIPNFGGPGSDMIQGGDPQGNGQGGPGYQFKNEDAIPFDQPGFLAMANAGPDTNGSQFFFLNGKWTGGNPATCAANASSQGCYTVFGKVVSGLDVVHKIASVPRDTKQGSPTQDRPLSPVTITSVTIAVS